MCYYVQQATPRDAVEKRFRARVDNPELFLVADTINGFGHDNIPVILDRSPDVISTDYHWGLIPTWSSSPDVRKSTLNARIETASEKPVFSESINSRCLVIASAFYEWRWLDEKGKQKQKHIIFSSDDEILCFAGIYSNWRNPSSGEYVNSYSILTTAANEAMEFIHNTKKRMPVVLRKQDEAKWLDSDNPISDFAFPAYKPNLVAFPL